jgi:uncharacterized Zn-binding protein involved in type VI secretion
MHSPRRLTRGRSAVLAIVAAFLALTASSFAASAQDETTATGSLEIFNVACTTLDEGTAEVAEYEGAATGELPAIDPDCHFASGTYTVYPFGVEDEAEVIVLTTDESGIAVSDLPVTDDQAPHIIVEDSTGVTTEFTVTEGSTTSISFIGPAAQDDAAATPETEAVAEGEEEAAAAEGDDETTAEGEEAAAEGDPAAASELPATGQGQSNESPIQGLWLAVGAGALFTLAAGAFTLHRRRS